MTKRYFNEHEKQPRLPLYAPPPSAGRPAGLYHNGAAEGGGHVGRLGRPWRPARAVGYAFQCPACGIGYHSEEEADDCCPKEARP